MHNSLTDSHQEFNDNICSVDQDEYARLCQLESEYKSLKQVE